MHNPRWRIALALLASLAIHLATLVGLAVREIEHIERSESPPLAVRIAPLAPVVATKPEAVAALPRRKPKPLPEAATAALPPPKLAEADTAPLASPIDIEPAASTDDAQARVEPTEMEPAASQSAEPPIAFPERIELAFDIAKNANEATLIRVVHSFERDGARYVIRSESALVGMAALFATGRYVQESRGIVTSRGLQPEQFVVRRGRTERTESATFDWTSSRATTTADGATKEWTLQAGAQDQLSYLHQLSFLIADPLRLTVMITNGRRFYSTKVEIMGREFVDTGLGPINALRVRCQLEGQSRIDAWLAPDYGNLPVKIRIRDRRGDEFEQVLTAMKVK